MSSIIIMFTWRIVVFFLTLLYTKVWNVCTLLSGRPNVVYVASNHFVWRLVPVSISSQIRQLLQDKQFELALQLAVSAAQRSAPWLGRPLACDDHLLSWVLFFPSRQKMKDDSDGDKKQQIHHIQNLYAFNLFCQKRFDDSMQVFAKLGTGESPDDV